MKLLIAIKTCHAYRARVTAQRSTWLLDTPSGLDVKFFLGRGRSPLRDDEIQLDVDDSYNGLVHKTKAICKYVIDHGYDYVCMIDDDTYLRPERLLAAVPVGQDYAGRLRGPSGGKPYPYASGFCYWMSNRAAAIVAFTDPRGEVAEDRLVGNTLYATGFKCHPDYRYVILPGSERNAPSGVESPLDGNDVIAVGEVKPLAMAGVHHEFNSGVKSALTVGKLIGPFDRVSVMVKTFLRDGYLTDTLRYLPTCLPGAKMIVVDDGYESKRKITTYADLRRTGHVCSWLPFDSGFGAKSNEAVKSLDREYLLVASDDFDFSDPRVRAGVERLMAVLDHDKSVGVASGRVNHIPYEGFVERGPGFIKEIPLDTDVVHTHYGRDVPLVTPGGVPYYLCDLTVNYSLVRASVFHVWHPADSTNVPRTHPVVHWDERFKIGGDHFVFFDQVRHTGFKVCWIPGVNINQQKYDRSKQHATYDKYRARARAALPAFFKDYGIVKYVGFDGREDVIETPVNTPPVTWPGKSRKTGNWYVSDERLYLNGDGGVVPKGDPSAKQLLVPRGGRIPVSEARRLGLV